MDVEEVKATTKKTKEESVESKKPVRATFHNATTKPDLKCVLCNGPHQITSCKKWGETLVKNRWEIAKENYFYLLECRPSRKRLSGKESLRY